MRFLALIVLLLLFTNPAWAETASDDVPIDHWANPAMNYLFKIGLLEGYPEEFWDFESVWREKHNSGCLTRYEFSQGVARALDSFKLEDYPFHVLPLLNDLRMEFREEISKSYICPTYIQKLETLAQDPVPLDHWAYNAMGYLVEMGLLPAAYESKFDKSKTLTRYDFALLISRLLNDQELAENFLEPDDFKIFRVMVETLRAEFSTHY